MIKKFTFFSTILNEERTIRIYVPKRYKVEEHSYPVLYMHDGQNVLNDEEAVGGTSLLLERYFDQHDVEIIVVAIDSKTGEDRINEFCPWVNGEYSRRITGNVSSLGGKGTDYVDFIVKELKPYIDNEFRTLKQQTYMGGISLGGLISTYAMCRYPHIFTRVAAISSAYFRNQEEIEQLIRNTNLSTVDRFYLDCGTKELSHNEAVSREFVISNKAIYEMVKDKISVTHFETINNAEHSYAYFQKRIPSICSFLL
ncbi:alpha/beta hydrolase [Bacillus solimangrovi]|uniref:Esterase n=1 Tax=Bacillus solimangrovi TaxID=1305675 RepID=A0A1E5LEQ4_9BACI|nr:alpha/beta hydrolase-fold protein [Bacillus solimangrovi]OEH92563.1 esterase [Bacillus solimangrovi]